MSSENTGSEHLAVLIMFILWIPIAGAPYPITCPWHAESTNHAPLLCGVPETLCRKLMPLGSLPD